MADQIVINSLGRHHNNNQDRRHHRFKTPLSGHMVVFLMTIIWITLEPILCREEKTYSNTFAVQIKPPFGDEAAHQLAKQHGFINHGKIGSLEDHYLFEHHSISKRSTEHSHEHHSKLKSDPRVLWVEQQVVKKRVKRGFQDVTQTISDPLFKEQWYINKGARDGYDMNVFGAWQRGFTGKGVVVTILDDGIQPNHPDLEGNYDPLASFDVNGNDPDPTPQDNGDNKHGTRCAGEIAAIAGNDICGVGIAFNSSIGGVRMLDGVVTDEVEARALGLNPNHIDIYSASWGPEDDGKTVDGPGRLAKRAFIDGIKKGRRGKGSIFVWASGNGGRRDDNCNCDGYTNSIYTLSISSATQSGTKPWYLEECSSTLATTYSSGSIGRDQNIVTVDMDTSYFESLVKGLPGDASRLCTKSHTGTSASAPIAAAICALALEANPNLTWRDMQHIVVMTSRYEPLKGEPGWFSNGLGRNVSHKFGYGLMDAEAMVKLAERWHPLPPQIICETPVHEERLVIPASTSSQLEVSLNWTGCSGTSGDIKYLEHVQTRVYLQFTPRGSLKISLMSPSGTVSTLLTPRVKDMTDSAFEQWPFLSVHFWGENPRGTWKLIIKNDLSPVDKPGQLISWGMTFYGISEPVPSYEDSSRSVRFLPRRVMTTKCPKSMFLNLESNECVKDCPDGYFGHVETVECTKCNSQCSTCYGPSSDNCVTCDKGYYYFADKCLKQCPKGYFADNQLAECLPCSHNCKTCQDFPGQCTSCPVGFKLDPASSKCFSVCKSSHCNPCPRNCISCGGPSLSSSSPPKDDTCNLCKKGFKLLNGICSTESCPRDHYEHLLVNSQSSECRKCHESCETCYGPSHTQCQSCFNNSPLKDGLCLPCPHGEFFNPATKSCDLCHESCSACTGPSPTDCTECRFPLLLNYNRCVPCCSKVSSQASSSSPSSSPSPGSTLTEKSNQPIDFETTDCCQCENPNGPCAVPERPRSLSSFGSVPVAGSSPVNGDSPFKGKFLLQGLIRSPSTVIFVICFSSLFLFVIIFIVLQLVSSPEAGPFSRKSYRRYTKISNSASYRHSQEKISLTCDDLDDEEDRLFEKT